MAILVVADHHNEALLDSTSKTVTAARKIGGDVDILVAGENCKPVADAAAKIAGVRKILCADDARYGHRLAEPLAALIVSLAANYDVLMKAAATTGKNVMPRVAALLDVMQVSEVIDVVAPDTFVRPIYAGNALQTVQSSDKKKVLTVRATAFKAAEQGGAAAIEKVAPAADPGLSQFVKEELTKSERPELTAAKIVISGGRALGSYENFEKYIFPVADKLGAAV
ncbi:MAG: electron transfer flavoprotein subunit alpha/FixB family protein, partial [Parvularculaceae bacterium]